MPALCAQVFNFLLQAMSHDNTSTPPTGLPEPLKVSVVAGAGFVAGSIACEEDSDPAEVVNDCETPTERIYCRASAVQPAAGGGLIHTAVGIAGGVGGF